MDRFVEWVEDKVYDVLEWYQCCHTKKKVGITIAIAVVAILAIASL